MDKKIESQVEKAIESFRDREERKCNVIFHNIPEPTASNKKEEDGGHLREILTAMKCEEINPKAFVRLGKPIEGKPRLMKVVLESVGNKHQFLSGTKLLRTKDGDGNVPHGWSNIFVTPDLTKEERDHSKRMRIELDKRRRDEENPQLVIYRGKIVDRREISQGNGKSNGLGNGGGSQPVMTV